MKRIYPLNWTMFDTHEVCSDCMGMDNLPECCNVHYQRSHLILRAVPIARKRKQLWCGNNFNVSILTLEATTENPLPTSTINNPRLRQNFGYIPFWLYLLWFFSKANKSNLSVFFFTNTQLDVLEYFTFFVTHDNPLCQHGYVQITTSSFFFK